MREKGWETTNYMEYRVNEIFGPSIQGEGSLAGYSTIFIRLAGCNLKCSFCDTDYTIRERLGVNQILNKILCLGKPDDVIITLTGGEPMTQSIVPLCRKLFETGYRITIETNGTLNLPNLYPYLWNVTVSPKLEKAKCKIDWNHVDAVKCLWPSTLVDPIDFKYLPNTIEKFIQPISGNYDVAIKKVKELGYPWRLSIQMQKLLGEEPKASPLQITPPI
jgi:organic radical activating enzyme